MKRNTVYFALLGCLVIAPAASAAMVHQEWHTRVDMSRQAIIDFLVDLANPVPEPDYEGIIEESAFVGARDQYVAKFYGWVTVPETGTYQFHYACDDYGMLYVSQDEYMENAVEVAYVDGWCNIAEWNKYPSQHSEPMQLRKGQIMAVMAFFQEEGGGDNMDIGWTGPAPLSSDITNPTYLTDYITHIPPTPTKARDPNPEDYATDVPRDVVLSWGSGKFAATHDVYMGTDFDDVNEATRADPRGVLVSQGQTATTYDPPGLLDFGTTYYWRIDEVNAPPSSTIFDGKIWNFTTEPFAYPVANIIATSNGDFEESAGPENTVDGSGIGAADQHSTEASHMFLAYAPEDEALWIQYEFDRVYKLHEMLVWNYNVQFELLLGFGLKDITVEYSVDGEEWTSLGDVEFAQATARATYLANTTVAFDGVPVKYVRLTANSNWGGMPQFGLSEVRFLFIPAHAREPQPADGAANVSVDSTLAWRAGRDAVSHEVYFGTDAEALDLAGTVSGTSYAPGALNLATTYYWQVNAVQETESWDGAVWSFATQPYLVVDDFESYTDDIDAGEAIFDTWLDGWVNETGSTVGHMTSPFAERNMVRSGRQAMPLFYENTGGVTIAEAVREFATPQNWAVSGIRSLSLYFMGDPDNTGQLYVKIGATKVPYDGDPAALKRGGWQAWNIDLSAVGNVSNVRSLTIGVEGAGASGVLYIDDVRLYPNAPEYITPVDPEPTGLVAHYTFDEGSGTRVGDSSGYGNHGTVHGDPQWVAGVIGGAMAFDGVGDYVDCGNDASLVIRDSITISCWIKVASFTRDWETILAMGDDSYRIGRSATTGNSIHFGCNGLSGGNIDASTIVTTDTWRHVAVVYDGEYTVIYIDGIEDVRVASTGQIDASAHNLYIGENSDATGRYLEGLVDDVRIYNRPLSDGEIAGLSGQTMPRHRPF